jgi:hypothetical protein
MIRQSFRYLSKQSKIVFAWVTLLAFLTSSTVPAAAMNECDSGWRTAAAVAAIPADNWWNLDISAWPADVNSQNYINFVGTSRQLHPDFGGRDTSTQYGIYGHTVCRGYWGCRRRSKSGAVSILGRERRSQSKYRR